MWWALCFSAMLPSFTFLQASALWFSCLCGFCHVINIYHTTVCIQYITGWVSSSRYYMKLKCNVHDLGATLVKYVNMWYICQLHQILVKMCLSCSVTLMHLMLCIFINTQRFQNYCSMHGWSRSTKLTFFVHLVFLYMPLNVHVSVIKHITVLLQRHQFYIKIIFSLYVKLSLFLSCPYLGASSTHNKPFIWELPCCWNSTWQKIFVPSGACWLYNTHLMIFWIQLLKYLLSATGWLAVRWHILVYVISFLISLFVYSLSINFPRHLIKLGYFMSIANCEKILVHLADITWLVSLFPCFKICWAVVDCSENVVTFIQFD